MAKKQWIIGSVLVILGIVFIVMSAVTPLIVDKHIKTQSKDKAELTSSNKKSYWGEIPGKLKEVVFITYNFFHLENPNQVLWNGAVPSLTEKNGYVYQEFSEFVDLDYDGNEIEYFEFTKQVKNKNCIWSNFTHPNDKVTTVNVGSFMVWNQLKHISRERMALNAFYYQFYQLTSELSLEVYTRSIFSAFGSFSVANQSILAPAGFSEEQAYAIYYDSYYGMASKETMAIWVEILIENVQSNQFDLSVNMTGTLYDLAIYFTFTEAQLSSLFSGNLLSKYIETIEGVYSWYQCSSSINNMQMCDPVELGSLQWSSSSITSNPYKNLWTSSNSITNFWPFITGYPEISTYMQSTTIGNKYPQVSFSPNLFPSLFYFNWTSGWPLYSPYTLMDVGKMDDFFEMAYGNNFNGIASLFKLPSVSHARVLWDYVNSVVDNTALQGNSDPGVFDYLNRGISSELGMGMVASEAIQQVFQIFSVDMPFTVTALYGYTQLEYFQNLTCDLIVEDVLPEVSYICTFPELVWDNSTIGYQKWLGVYWYGLYSVQSQYFMNVSGLSLSEMEMLFATNGSLVGNFTQLDESLKSYYNCTNYGLRCSGEYMATTQLINSTISRNLPKCLSLLGIVTNSSTFYGLENINIGLQMPSEYYVYADSSLTLDEGNLIFSQNGLFNFQNMQKFFMNIYSKNYDAITSQYSISDPLLLADYFRAITNQYYFNGLFITKTVDEILFTYQDPLILKKRTISPLIGGNPTASYQKALLGKNQTREQWEYLPDSFKHKTHTGKSSSSNTRKMISMNGQSYLNSIKLEYSGEGPTGPNVNYVNYNPWQNKTKFKGTNGWAFRPDIDDSTDLYFTSQQNCLTFPLKYVKKKTRSGLECLRFELSNAPFLNSTQDAKMKNFYNNAPTGMINLTSVTDLPFFLSRPYFLNGDKKVQNLVSYTTLQYNFPENYHTYFDVEKYTGVPLYQKQQFQYNLQLKPDIMFPMLASSSIESVGYLTYLPVYFTQRSYLLTDSHVDDHFEYIKTDLLVSEVVLYVGVFIGCGLIVAAMLYALKIYINKKRELKTMVVSQTHQPILLA